MSLRAALGWAGLHVGWAVIAASARLLGTSKWVSPRPINDTFPIPHDAMWAVHESGGDDRVEVVFRGHDGVTRRTGWIRPGFAGRTVFAEWDPEGVSDVLLLRNDLRAIGAEADELIEACRKRWGYV